MTAPTVLLTRPRADSEALLPRLAALGIEALIEPLMDIELVEAEPLDPRRFQAVLITSANGARALAPQVGFHDLPVLAVGEASASAARDAGFALVAAADGDVAALVELACDTLDPGRGALLHVAGRQVAGDLSGDLRARGFTVERRVLYEARAHTSFSNAAHDALAQGDLGAVLLFSPRTTRIFVTLAKASGLESAAETLDMICLSKAVAKEGADLPWRGVRIARHPRLDSLLDEVAKVFNDHGDG